ncbi:MAG: hypothetical protein NVS3B12_16300 [Acidimicrobiales bacterium]
MAQPQYVPVTPRERVRVSERLPTPDGWIADRVAEVRHNGAQPVGPQFGVAGPDQGYALKLAHHLQHRVILGSGEHFEDAAAGCLGVALRRAARYGRSPVIGDVELAFAVWGFLADAPRELIEFRRPLFEAVSHHYNDLRALAERVPASTLEMTPSDVSARLPAGGWRILLGLEG